MFNYAKKIISIFSVLIIICVAEPAFAATAKNPFIDVPENSWAYDAIVRLASRGIISGYPDGLYKGKNSLTRYEAASIVAKAIAYFDRSKANVQDAEMLKKLAAEFEYELNAIKAQSDGVLHDEELFKERLNGWRLSGSILMDADYRNALNIGSISGSENMGNIGLGEAIFNMERWYGGGNELYFHSQLRTHDESGVDSHSPSLNDMYYFYTRVPLYLGSFLTVGKAGADNLDTRFAYTTSGSGRYSTSGWFDDSPLQMMRVDLNFVILNFTSYVAHGNVHGAGGTKFDNGIWDEYSPHAWNIFTNLDVKLSQYLGFGLGAQYLVHDDWNVPDSLAIGQGKAWDNIFTSWLGVDYNLSNEAAIHGIIYYQRAKTDDNYWGSGSVTDRPDGGIAIRAALDIDQSLLKFTSLYAEYMKIPSGFFALDGIENNMLLGEVEYEPVSFFGNVANHDISMWKIGANQKWNDKLSSWIYYADINGRASSGYSSFDAGVRQYGAGIEYAYKNNMLFGLNYLKWDGKDDWNDKSYSRIRFSTHIAF